MATFLEKDGIDAVEFSTDHWVKAVGADGSRIYTATATATAKVIFTSATADQDHTGIPIDSTFARNKDGSWEIMIAN